MTMGAPFRIMDDSAVLERVARKENEWGLGGMEDVGRAVRGVGEDNVRSAVRAKGVCEGYGQDMKRRWESSTRSGLRMRRHKAHAEGLGSCSFHFAHDSAYHAFTPSPKDDGMLSEKSLSSGTDVHGEVCSPEQRAPEAMRRGDVRICFHISLCILFLIQPSLLLVACLWMPSANLRY